MESFTVAGGYAITEINETVNRFAFRQFLENLEDARGGIYLGFPQPIGGDALYQIFSQIRGVPVTDGIVAIDIGGVIPTIDYVNANGGWGETWVIGNDRGGGLRGTTGDDVILGGRGDDVVLSRTGNDFVNAGDGDDLVGGGNGADTLFGSDGDDRIRGRGGDDILQGGAGEDTLVGGPGADTFMFTDLDFQGPRTVDVIRDYRPQQGDQIVDTTALLEVVEFGRIEGYGRATLLENSLTGHQVVVYGARVFDKAILNAYEEPSANPPSARSEPAKGIYVGGEVAQINPNLSFRVERIDGIQDGDQFIESFRVFVTNGSEKTLINTNDLDLKLAGGSFDVLPGSVFGGSYAGGSFDLSSGGRRALPAGEEVSVLQFSVANRPVFETVTIDPTSTQTFRPEYAGGGTQYYQPAFQIEVRFSDTEGDTGDAEIFITNIGTGQLKNLDNLEFSFNDPDVAVQNNPWGAVFYNDTFAVEPWGTDAAHADLAAGETIKLFGFSYEIAPTSDAEITVSDFRLTSPFADLIA